MIAPLRRRHRWMITVLSLVVPLLFFAALSQRPQHDLNRTDVDRRDTSQTERLTPFFDNSTIEGRLLHEGASTKLQVTTLAAPRQPDLLLYWSPGPASADLPSAGLPSDAVLLGPLPARAHRSYHLPPAITDEHLLLYSLAHQELIDATPLVGRKVAASSSAAATDRLPTEPTSEVSR